MAHILKEIAFFCCVCKKTIQRSKSRCGGAGESGDFTGFLFY